MPDKDDPENTLPEDESDAALWRRMTRDVKRLPGKSYKDAPPQKRKTPPVRETVLPPKRPAAAAALPAAEGAELDKRTLQRLERGEIALEARIDLHGLDQTRAHERLTGFIQEAHRAKKRCVLVITGTGKSRAHSEDWWVAAPGILKKKVPEWLKAPPLSPLVLKTVPARAKDGGAGAFYVLLRRHRSRNL